MKASVIRGFGGPEVFEFCDLDVPTPATDEVLIKVHACGINHFDIFLRRGEVNKKLPLPHVMGADIVGEVADLGCEVHGFNKGDRVIVAPGYPVDPADYDFHPINFAGSYSVTGGAKWGGYAEFMTAPAQFVIADPPDLPSDQLATIPLVLITAVHAVKTLAQVSAGQKVLVQAGASGSGSMCVQVAKALGAQVAATVGSDDKFDFARSVGADMVINYRKEDFVERVQSWTEVRGVDVVIDNVGGSVFEGNIKVLKRGGRFVNFGMVGGRNANYVFPLIFYKQLHLCGSMMGTLEELNWGLELVRQGRIKPMLDRKMPLREAAQAHGIIEDRQVQGKLVLVPS